jgi:hypothetical protein
MSSLLYHFKKRNKTYKGKKNLLDEPPSVFFNCMNLMLCILPFLQNSAAPAIFYAFSAILKRRLVQRYFS